MNITLKLPFHVALAVLCASTFGTKRRILTAQDLDLIQRSYTEIRNQLIREASTTRSPLLRALYTRASRWLLLETIAINTLLDGSVAMIGELPM